NPPLSAPAAAGKPGAAALLPPGPAVLLQRLLDNAVESLQLAAAAAEHDVLEHALLELRIEARHHVAQSLHDRLHQHLARFLQGAGHIERRRLARDRPPPPA